MTTLTVTSKGQVTLRKDVLQHLGVEAGQKLQITKLPGGRLEMRAPKKTGRIEDVFGLFADKNTRRATLEEISQAIEDGWAGKV